ncbi:glycosyltransferase family 4 protein [Nocardioides piscis]|uniref:Glycosyltransferase family 4 protein n=1 Tax=Nocardioides piscis TaxID=2714938 RepID=A0A6G7YE82_9ACTN|nr:glycosyltransferase family 1 protein [Nocardioides piscis]QIK75214.1 glycosyltransferase family 4 protein [Nocardioides piscis]
MRLVIDATGAELGGIHTYARHLISAWRRTTDDDLHVLTPANGIEGVDPNGLHLYPVPARPPALLRRPVAQTRLVSRLVDDLSPDAVLAAHPATTLLHPGVPLVVVVHDLRHELRPAQFSRVRRLSRALAYERSYRLADGFVAISQRTLDDLHRLHPATASRRASVVHHGADHADGWSDVAPHGSAVTFAHHSNKNLDLVLDAWSMLPGAPPLRVLGVAPERRPGLEAELRRRRLLHVEPAPYLSDEEFEAALAGASAIVFPSDFEGFGLPIVEGMRRGVPVVIGPDAACLEVAGGHAFAMTAFTASELARATLDALASSEAQREAARAYAERFTWERSVTATRLLLASVSSAARGPG